MILDLVLDVIIIPKDKVHVQTLTPKNFHICVRILLFDASFFLLHNFSGMDGNERWGWLI